MTHGLELLPFASVVTSSEYGLSVRADEAGNVAILGMQNLRDGKLTVKDCSRVALTENLIQKYRVLEGDLLFNRTNSAALVGKTAVATSDLEAVFASYLVRFKLDRRKVRPQFVGYYMNCGSSIRRLRALATPGVSQSNINPTTLQRHFRIWIPSLEYQDYCLSVLSAWDRAIDQAEQLVALKERRKRALMQQLLTGKRRFPEFDEPWRIYKLADLFTERNESNRPDLKLLSITADRGVICRSEVERKDTSNVDKARYKRIAPGDIGYNTMRMWQGVSALSQLEGIVSPAYTVAIPGPKVCPRFIGHLFKTPAMIHRFYRYSQGLVDDTRNLKFKQFSQVSAEIPPIEEQRRIALVFDACDEELGLLRDQINALKQQKKGLMQKLLTGQVRVPIAAEDAQS